ncbi:MAG: xanthan lyase [Dehalococcoidia bacterium]|nr:xanthan lyase [Dehalococcoidia bacterium]
MPFVKSQLSFALGLIALVVGTEAPSLPRPDQVDKPEMIRFIVPDIKKLPGIVVDDVQATLVGKWQHSVHTPPFVGASYIHDMKESKGGKSATFTPNLPKAGLYEVRMSHNSNIRRANGVPVTIRHAAGETVVKVNEGEPAPIEKLFRSLGTFRFHKGTSGSVTINTQGTDGKYVIVDAVQFLPVE